MFKRLGVIIFAVLTSTQLFAFTCYMTVVKDSCWTNFDVNMQVMDAVANKLITTVSIPKGTAWTRQKFECSPGTKMLYKATYTPLIWQSEVGKVYMAKNYWTLPVNIKTGDSAWDVPVCFPKEFAEVPFPPDAQGNCQCNFKVIPPVPPAKI